MHQCVYVCRDWALKSLIVSTPICCWWVHRVSRLLTSVDGRTSQIKDVNHWFTYLAYCQGHSFIHSFIHSFYHSQSLICILSLSSMLYYFLADCTARLCDRLLVWLCCLSVSLTIWPSCVLLCTVAKWYILRFLPQKCLNQVNRKCPIGMQFSVHLLNHRCCCHLVN